MCSWPRRVWSWLWPVPLPPVLTAALTSAGSHSRDIFGFPWCIVLVSVCWAEEGSVVLRPPCHWIFPIRCFGLDCFILDEWAQEPWWLNETCVSMLIFFYPPSQEGVGLTPFGRAGLLAAKGRSWAPLPLSPAVSMTASLVLRDPCPLPFSVSPFPHSVFKYGGEERALGPWVVLAGQERAMPARNARHSGGVGGWAASSFLNVLGSNCTGMKCMCIACLSLEITVICILLMKPFDMAICCFCGECFTKI